MFLVAWVYVLFTVILPARCPLGWKVSGCVLALVSCEKLRIISWLGSDWFSSPDGVPRLLVQALVFVYSLGVMFLCLTLLSDLLQAVPSLWLLWRRRIVWGSWLAWRSGVHVRLIVLASVLTVWGLYQGHQPPQVERVELRVPGLHPKAEGLTLAVLTDLHGDPYFGPEHIARMVQVANGTDPDFMVLVGDFMDGSPERRRALLEPLAELRPKVATLGVAGNHEYYSGYGAWRPILQHWGVRMLDNAHAEFPEHGVSMIGLTDPAALRAGLEGPDVRKAVRGRDRSLTGIGLVHRPGLVGEWESVETSMRPQVQFSGHTHGGMAPLLRVGIGLFNGGFYGGLHEVNGIQLYVSRGAGIWNGMPLRVWCPAEVTLVTLRGGRGSVSGKR